MNTLVLLRDFDHWFQQLPLRLPGVSRLSLEPLRHQLIEALQQVADVKTHDLAELRLLTDTRRTKDEFLVTLDGGIYFRDADYSFAMTRAVTRLQDAERGRMIRVAREGYGQFWTQVSTLRRELEASGKSAIVLADDGIDTGRSLAEVVRQLNEQYLEVSSIRVLLNPTGMTHIANVPVDTISADRGVLWTHERDLFWGSPTGGVSLITRHNVNQLGGIPYTLNCTLLECRLGLKGKKLDDFRRELLRINIDFWGLLSRAADRPLRLRDCKRLMWAAALDGFSSQSQIIDVIEWLIRSEPSYEDTADARLGESR